MLSLNDCFLIEVWLIYDTVVNRVYGKMIQLYIYFQIISGINRYKPLQKINKLDKHQDLLDSTGDCVQYFIITWNDFKIHCSMLINAATVIKLGV